MAPLHDYHKLVSQAWILLPLQATKDIGVCTVPLQQKVKYGTQLTIVYNKRNRIMRSDIQHTSSVAATCATLSEGLYPATAVVSPLLVSTNSGMSVNRTGFSTPAHDSCTDQLMLTLNVPLESHSLEHCNSMAAI